MIQRNHNFINLLIYYSHLRKAKNKQCYNSRLILRFQKILFDDTQRRNRKTIPFHVLRKI